MLRAFIDKLSTKTSRGKREFAKRIHFRHKTFWDAPEAETVRNTIMSAEDPIEKWQDVENWQRKLSNKYNSREFAKKHGCKVAELYWKGRDVDQLPFDQLPSHFVIRPTVGFSCGKVFLMKNGINLLDQKAYTSDELLLSMKEALAENSYLEFLVEEFVRTEQGEYKIPVDYKVYTFNGVVCTIQVINRSGPSSGTESSFDKNWNLLDRHNIAYEDAGFQAPPACLDDIVKQASILSKAYGIFVRIDFYATDKGAVFGEFTPTPFKGNGFTPLAEKRYTEYWDLHCTGKI